MARKYICPAVFLLIIWGALFLPKSADGLELIKTGFLDQNLAGGRLGAWTSTGDEGLLEESDFSLEFSGSSVYGEFFYAHRISRILAVELSVGIFSRGDVRYYSEAGTYVSAVNVYPIALSAKLYPLHNVKSVPFHLYLQSGGSLVYAKQDVIDVFYAGYGLVSENSKAKFSYILGGGIDWPVASQIALTVSFKYMPVEFGDPLGQTNVKDYSGWTLTFGAGYLFGQ